MDLSLNQRSFHSIESMRTFTLKLIEVNPQGFCGGVVAAITKITKLRTDRPEAKITVLGNLVHNRFIQEALDSLNIQTLEAKGKTRLELLDEIEDGIVVFTAHGISDSVRKKAQEKGLEVLDASCPFVLQTQAEVKKRLDEGFVIFYIGKKGHPEAEALTSGDDRIFLIEHSEDIPKNIKQKIFVTNQTTMSILDTQALFDEIFKLYPQSVLHDEICSATRVRQNAVLSLQEQKPDVLIVVGDPTSNNTRQLADIGRKAHVPQIIPIETAADLDLSLIDPEATVAITSGASTPTLLRKQVVNKLESGLDPEPFKPAELLETTFRPIKKKD